MTTNTERGLRLALVGNKRVGKNTLAEMLVAQLGPGARVLELSAPLKEIARAVFPALTVQQLHGGTEHKETPDQRSLGGLTPRELLIRLGAWLRTDPEVLGGDGRGGRALLLEAALAQAERAGPAAVVIADVRLPAEAARLRAEGWVLVGVARASAGPPAATETERHVPRMLAELEHVVPNDGSLEDLRLRARALLVDVLGLDRVVRLY